MTILTLALTLNDPRNDALNVILLNKRGASAAENSASNTRKRTLVAENILCDASNG